MSLWKPSLYVSDTCRVCQAETETVEHLWECRATKEVRQQGWEKAIDEIAVNGGKAVEAAKKKWKRDKEAAEEKKSFTTPEPSFTPCFDTDKIWWSLRQIEGIEKMADTNDDDWQRFLDRSLENDEELPEGFGDGERPEPPRTWTTMDLFHGLTPSFHEQGVGQAFQDND
ncbi:hypothetical protein BGX33_001358, partial [Mortierella sp. NVP41]